MFIVSNFLIAIAKIIDIGLSLYMWLIIIRAIISWVNPDPYNTLVRFLHSATEPILYPIRRRLPLFFGGFDFSPVLVIMAIFFIQTFFVQSLLQLAVRMAQ
jgi:YggT family protein